MSFTNEVNFKEHLGWNDLHNKCNLFDGHIHFSHELNLKEHLGWDDLINKSFGIIDHREHLGWDAKI